MLDFTAGELFFMHICVYAVNWRSENIGFIEKVFEMYESGTAAQILSKFIILMEIVYEVKANKLWIFNLFQI